MKKIKDAENDIANKTPEMKFPLQMDSAKLDFGGKSKVRAEKIVMRDTKTGRIYGSRVVYQKVTSENLIAELLALNEANEEVVDEPLPEIVVGELKSNIRKGAKDIEQNWKNALELVHKAYEVSSVRRPTPDTPQPWKQYEQLIQFAVRQLANTRGMSGEWRMSQAVTESALTEARIFVSVPGSVDMEVEAKNIDEVVDSIINITRRHGVVAKVNSKNGEQAVLVLTRNGEELETVTIRDVS